MISPGLDTTHRPPNARISRKIEEGQLRLTRSAGATSVTHSYPKELEKLIKLQWKEIKPKWFITLQWTPPSKDFQTAASHSRHFRNKLLTSIYDCKLNHIPEPSDRCRMVYFHEKALDAASRITYHTHLHVGILPEPYRSAGAIRSLISRRVQPGFRSLHHLSRANNPSLVIVPWVHSHHASYNFKDYYRFRHHQDADLTLDLENSDLIFTK